MLQVEDPNMFDPQKSISAKMCVIDMPSVRITVLLKDLVPLSFEDFSLLKILDSLETRWRIATADPSVSPLRKRYGDLVLYVPPTGKSVLSIVRYLGDVPELTSNGWLVGLEVIDSAWEEGMTDGTVGNRNYFCVDRKKGVFCDIGSLDDTVGCSIESAQKLESLNQGYVSRMASLMDNMDNNNSKWNWTSQHHNKLNLTLSERSSQISGTVSDVTNASTLRKIHNDLRLKKKDPGSESEPSNVNYKEDQDRISPNMRGNARPSIHMEKGDVILTTRPTRSNRRRESESDQFSWDPNSKKRNSSASSRSKRGQSRQREGSRENFKNDTSFNSRKTSPLNTSYIHTQQSRPNSSTSPYISNSPLEVGQYYNQDLRENIRLASSLTRSASLEFGCNGQDSGRDTPPSLPPRDRDTFATPHEETDISWEKKPYEQLSSQGGSPDQQFSPTLPESNAPPLEFVEPLREDIDVEVVVGSMVQLETQQGDKLFGVVKYIGDVPGPGRWAGVEMEEEVRGGNNGWIQNRPMFSCPEGKGVFVPYSHVIPDPRFKETLPPPPCGQDFGPKDSPIVPGYCPPCPTVENVGSMSGRNKGIQGHQNSCYLDATLFSMFCFTSVFDSLLYRPRGEKDIARYEEVQRVLREEIVNPLRKSLFVRADKVMNLRTMLDSLSDVQGLTDQEKDPEEFLTSILTQVMKAEPYLELSSGQTAHLYQLFVEKDPDLPVPTVQDLFDQSFNTSRVKLRRAPPVLILQMPRFGRQFKVYDRILPSQLLDVTDIISSSPRQCVICGVLAEWECPSCYGDHDSGLASTAFCEGCLHRTHQHKRRLSHKQERLNRPPGWSKQQSQQPIPRIFMELVAVVCIETSHYVSFVRCGDSPRAPWCFFDSMADRKGEQNGYNIPELAPAPDVEKILSDSGATEVKSSPNMVMSEQAKRLVSDAYMCFYQSPDVRMYR